MASRPRFKLAGVCGCPGNPRRGLAARGCVRQDADGHRSQRVRCGRVRAVRRSPALAVGISILLVMFSAAACRARGAPDAAHRIEVGSLVAVRPNHLTRAVAVLTTSDERDADQRVDVYRMLDGTLPTIWPLEPHGYLSSIDLQLMRTCEVQRLSSWIPASGIRIDGLWTVGIDGSVLSHEYRFFGGEGWEKSSLVMRDGSGNIRWDLSPSEIFPIEETGEFQVRSHGYDWIIGIAILADTESV